MKLGNVMWAALIGIGSLQMAAEARAEAIPAALHGKSVVLSWSDARTVKDTSGNQKNVNQTSQIELYVSDLGRVFSRFERHTRPNDVNTLTQVSGAPDNYLQWRFESGTLIADQKFTKGMRRVTISFSDSFGNCSISVLHGKEVGAQAIHYNDLTTNADYEIITIAVTATSCSMQSGNIFANTQ
jgi:hypothetical protein